MNEAQTWHNESLLILVCTDKLSGRLKQNAHHCVRCFMFLSFLAWTSTILSEIHPLLQVGSSTLPGSSLGKALKSSTSLLLLAAASSFSFTDAKHLRSKDGEFITLARLGLNTTSKETAAAIASDIRGNLYFTGTTETFTRGGESDLTEGDGKDLRGKDIFIAKYSASTEQIEWVVRTGTSGDEEAQGIAVDSSGSSLYVVGRTNGQYGSTARKGQYDMLLVKYDISRAGMPVQKWKSPITVGTSSSEEAADVALDSSSGFVYVIGYTRGDLFPSNRKSKTESDWDAFIFRCRDSDGDIDMGRQFGTDTDDIAKQIVLPQNNEGVILVGVETVRQVGNIGVKNMNIFTLRLEDLTVKCSVLVKTYSPETIVGLSQHPFFPDSLFVGGSTWLSAISGWDFALKKVGQKTRTCTEGSSSIIDVGSLDEEEYALRQGSINDADDIAVSMKLSPASGRIWMTGTTTGKMTKAVVLEGDSQIVVAAIDPESGTTTVIAQEESQESTFTSVADFAFFPDSTGICYVATRLNPENGNLYVLIGTYGIPEKARAAIPVPVPKPSVLPSPAETNDRQETLPTAKGIMPIAIGGGVAGVVIIIGILIALFAVCRVRKRSETLKAGRLRQNPPKRVGKRERVQRPPPVARPSGVADSRIGSQQTQGVVQPNATGLY
jgi:regulator of extracellular matrix RemA (YlzA/DUF370 family)